MLLGLKIFARDSITSTNASTHPPFAHRLTCILCGVMYYRFFPQKTKKTGEAVLTSTSTATTQMSAISVPPQPPSPPYFVRPTLSELEKLTDEELNDVINLEVGHEDHGKIVYTSFETALLSYCTEEHFNNTVSRLSHGRQVSDVDS